MADNGWVDGVCHVEPGLPKLLILSLERIGVMEPPEYAYREYTSKGILRCDMMVFVAKSTRYPDVDPWFISTSSFRFHDTYRKAAHKALRRLRVIYKHHLQRTPMGFYPPTEGRGRTWIARMRGLRREEEDLEDTVSHLSIYLTSLDALYREQADKSRTRRVFLSRSPSPDARGRKPQRNRWMDRGRRRRRTRGNPLG
jgi:hypothetical protein